MPVTPRLAEGHRVRPGRPPGSPTALTGCCEPAHAGLRRGAENARGPPSAGRTPIPMTFVRMGRVASMIESVQVH